MPIWKVSHTDGIYQVADADGALYPLTMHGQPVREFNAGWQPRGLQTGLPPLHVLELEHASEGSAIWLHDETLDFKANSVATLPESDFDRLMTGVEPVIRTIHTECVLAPHASIPAAAHQFDGMLPGTVRSLLFDAVNRILPAPERVVLERLEELQAGYGNGEARLSRDWIARAFASADADAQERFPLPGQTCFRHLDAATGIVFYLLRTDAPGDAALFVPSANVLFTRGHGAHQPLLDLIVYYASNTDRVVSLPEVDLLAPEMMAPPQHGLDEPPLHETGEPYDPPRTVFEAPLSEIEPAHAAHGHDAVGSHTAWTEDAPAYEPSETVTDAPRAAQTMSPPGSPAGPPPAPPKQNWWQRLLGLGNS
ncbi:hypothetical protein NFI95_08025 [Acetobacteraceae bacterium KSS8]|uniref:DUF4238 domain-containing protein n=1 Tax=Endosaccharibacter trunci TaxID=2812733 RepID=A0ABT1W692_9PROT|nr:hypothetical protein [Acetobacteraceae bacterium KSS8]